MIHNMKLPAMYFVFCRLYPFPPPPPATTAVLGPTLLVISLLLTDTVSPLRSCYSHEGRGFVRPTKKTIVGLLVFNPLWGAEYRVGAVDVCFNRFDINAGLYLSVWGGGGIVGDCKKVLRIAATEGLWQEYCCVDLKVFFKAYSCKLFSTGALSHGILTKPWARK